MRLVFATDLHDSAAAPAWVEKMAKTKDLCLLGGDYGFNIVGQLIEIIKKYPNIIAVEGNHDYPINYGPHVLHGTKIHFRGYTIGGIGGSLPVAGWPFEISDSEYAVLVGKLGLVDILVSHQPAYDTPVDITFQKRHVGSLAIRKYIEQTQPLLAVSGHIHESSGIGKIGNTVIANPGPLFQGRYLEVDIVGQKVTRAKVFYNKSLEWPSAAELLRQSRQKKWALSDLEPSLTRSRKAS